LNKQGGNAGTGNVQVGSGFNDAGSCWNLIALTDYNWTLRSDCFTVSDTNNRYFYKIKSQNNASYCIKPGTNYVETSNVNDDDMIWYFEEAASDALMTYYYIRHANTGQYLRYRSTGVGQDNAIELVTHTGSETGNDEARFQFIVVRGTNSNEPVNDSKGVIFNIIPKLLNNNTYINSVSCDKGQGLPLKTKADRNGNQTHWSFESVEYSTDCTAPTITFSNATGKATISTTTTRSSIYYTTDVFYLQQVISLRKQKKEPLQNLHFAAVPSHECVFYTDQYMPPMSPMPGAAAGAGGSGLSATRDSVVSTMPLTEAAFSRAQRVTLAGSTMPLAIMSQ
jgi:hypothetical protein